MKNFTFLISNKTSSKQDVLKNIFTHNMPKNDNIHGTKFAGVHLVQEKHRERETKREKQKGKTNR